MEVKENEPETKQLLIYASNHTHMNHKSIMITCSNLKLSSRALKRVRKKKESCGNENNPLCHCDWLSDFDIKSFFFLNDIQFAKVG